MLWTDPTPASALAVRRTRLANTLGDLPALVVAGTPRARNYPANRYPFRAESHFLYLAGAPLAGAALLVARGRSTLFAVPPEDDDALWHGEAEGFDALRARTGVDAVESIERLPEALAALGPKGAIATIPANDDITAAWQSQLLGRPIAARTAARVEGVDATLADALIGLRLVHDEPALAQIRRSVEATVRGHRAGARATRPGVREAAVRAAIEAEWIACGMTTAYGSIVTAHGEVLHHESSEGTLSAGDLLLVDAGAENGEGWSSDVTRVYPASGTFSATQRAIYDVVLAANRAAIARVRPGVRYRDVHVEAARTIVRGLVDARVFRGDVDGLVERGAYALFFPHGVGHLLGLDVHDMEDLGDRAGYAPGRTRATRFGDRYLRLDRDLLPGMVVTIEPGFYQVPAILADDSIAGPFRGDLDREVLARFADVRGIRLEDDVLCTSGEPDVLTREIPIDAVGVEAWMRS
ncbi:MAG: aminopeptidase P family protein [Deltaproteobacteria bacterium]|nr:aminopeptidase P family protein [Deltaproteobacteria bacterium]